jgi:hypothetical protein
MSATNPEIWEKKEIADDLKGLPRVSAGTGDEWEKRSRSILAKLPNNE